jgi:hypothetical protein
VRLRLLAALLGTSLAGCGTASPRTTASRSSGQPAATPTADPVAAFKQRVGPHLGAIAETVNLINSCNSQIRCSVGAAAFSDATRNLAVVLTSSPPPATLPAASMFIVDVQRLHDEASKLFGAYDGGDRPSSALIDEANLVFASYNNDVSAMAMAPPAASLAPTWAP